MTKTHKLFKYVYLAPLFVLSIIVLQFAQSASASAATLEWDGSAGDSKFNTAANWDTNSVPVDGDVITLPGFSGTRTLENDLTGVSLAGVVLKPVSNVTAGTGYYVIDTLNLQDGATITKLTFSGVVLNAYLGLGSATHLIGEGDLTVSTLGVSAEFTVAGDLTVGGAAQASVTPAVGSVVTGNVIMNNNSTFSATTNTTVGGYVIGDNGSLYVASTLLNFSSPVTFDGTGGKMTTPSDTADCSDLSCTYNERTFNISSPITLNSDGQIFVRDNVTANFTGTITYNGHTITKYLGSAGTLILNGETIVTAAQTTSLDGDVAGTEVQVAENETATLNGTREEVIVYTGGILKGTGTATFLAISNNALINPGNSPGTITVLDQFYLAGTYQAEILNADSYDQIVAGEDYADEDEDWSAVVLAETSILSVDLYDGWEINQGDQFTIIDNRSDVAVLGIFLGLAEGTQFVVDGITFSITYEGGDGNDVVITALNTGTDPDAPNTGAQQLILANPILLVGLGVVTVSLLIAATRRRTNR
jgi:fibronectin-binding autotransporter adhesin